MVATVAMANVLAFNYGNATPYAALYTTAPGSSPGTEVTGGTPAYARVNSGWADAAGGVVTKTAVLNVPSGTTVVGAGLHSALTAGTYYDGISVTPQAYSSQGTMTVSFTFTAT